jgi:hypothetical protein
MQWLAGVEAVIQVLFCRLKRLKARKRALCERGELRNMLPVCVWVAARPIHYSTFGIFRVLSSFYARPPPPSHLSCRITRSIPSLLLSKEASKGEKDHCIHAVRRAWSTEKVVSRMLLQWMLLVCRKNKRKSCLCHE